MKNFLLIILILLSASLAKGVELQALPHIVVHDDRTYIRDEADRRYSVWTDDPGMAEAVMGEFGIPIGSFKLDKEKIFAVFFNDQIREDLIQITNNAVTKATFADYADSGIMFKLGRVEVGKKYSHLTAVVFSPAGPISHLGLRGMISGGLSDKK